MINFIETSVTRRFVFLTIKFKKQTLSKQKQNRTFKQVLNLKTMKRIDVFLLSFINKTELKGALFLILLFNLLWVDKI